MRSRRYQRGVWQWLIPAAAGVIGSIMGKEGQESANDTNLQSVREQIDFQREMSNTAMQRRVEDLRAAGLNPMLAGLNQQGAAVPPGASAQVGNIGAAAASAGASSAATASNVIQGVQQMAQSQATIDQTKAATDQIRSQTVDQALNSAVVAAEARKRGYEADTAGVEAWLREGVKKWSARGAMAEADSKENAARLSELSFKADLAERRAKSRGTQLDTAEKEIKKGLYEKIPEAASSARDWWNRLEFNVKPQEGVPWWKGK